ncbi:MULTISPECIES: PRC-barrel domain-containing protein [Brucella/Ochrobactrum group]|jgi:hypothetical protein|uniref:PRC-barrel domain-containing protein n=1 Tax=Brucella pseudintermedia TaxID=370111 RepID=A0ABY5UEG7_9HYPH|nr:MULTISPECIES: PRC-barrel domain-containing protein [Brucella/Ochrobactrum group]KAB2684023.1 PRC-barrel domain containing protein [Brucella pseudintermedia]MCO7726249.1 PRC-barrel domain-containing protein [Brucella intermedia]NKE77212.1 PRC-barrel domain containing protein [Ochrobactrum sp. MC-1LL]TWH03674.1 PRC-barrel domain protein [Ochrobactrum sp. J50]UWL60747.1 PRC-barrel domain-containing protein [Brucella pseudintermedia]
MFKTTLVTTTCALLIGGSALAQTAPSSSTPAQAPVETQDMPVSSKDMFGKPLTGEAGKVGFVEPKEGQLLVSSFIGQSVYESDAPDAQSVGKLNDLIASPDGQIEAAVIGVGGFLGVGEKDVAVSPDQLQLATRSDGKTWLVIKANKQQLNDAPAFDRSKFFADGVANPSAATETNAPATDAPANGTTPAPASPPPAQ